MNEMSVKHTTFVTFPPSWRNADLSHLVEINHDVIRCVYRGFVKTIPNVDVSFLDACPPDFLTDCNRMVCENTSIV